MHSEEEEEEKEAAAAVSNHMPNQAPVFADFTLARVNPIRRRQKSPSFFLWVVFFPSRKHKVTPKEEEEEEEGRDEDDGSDATADCVTVAL